MEHLSIISLDGHAQPPPEIWPEYLAQKYHEFLPGLRKENKWCSAILGKYLEQANAASELERFDAAGAIGSGGYAGLFDREIRLREMDREGIAAEVITHGDPHFSGLFFQSNNQRYAMELCQAGVKAYHRWVVDEFAPGKKRFLLAGIAGCAPWRGMEELLAEVDYLADHGFFACNLPGFTAYPHQPPLHDRYWDPFWARLQERKLMIYMHAGHGAAQGEIGREIARLYGQVLEQGLSLRDLANRVDAEVFEDGAVFRCLKPRRAVWQLMMGGVFDRFPGLRVVLSELYGDWIGVTLRLLDGVFEENRAHVAARRRPSEYWAGHFFTALSFMRKCDVAARGEIGVGAVGFGRDYPHTEGTWPNTASWLQAALEGCSGDEIRGILGGNFVEFAGLDAGVFAAVARRIAAPGVADFRGRKFAAGPELIAHFDRRSRFLAAGEGETRVAEMAALLREDLWRAGA